MSENVEDITHLYFTISDSSLNIHICVDVFTSRVNRFETGDSHKNGKGIHSSIRCATSPSVCHRRTSVC
jgi:hypothetical protein